MRTNSTFWQAALAVGLWAFLVPTLTQGQGRSREATEQARGAAEDRAETEADLALLKQIRQSLHENAELSDAAQRIRIIVDNGAVTLRGEVGTEEDKEGIGTQVRRVEGVQELHNRLRVAGREREATEPEAGAVEGLQAAFEQGVQAFNSRDLDTWATSWHDRVINFGPLSPFPADGKGALRQTFRAVFAANESGTFTPINAQYRVVGTTGMAWGYYMLAVKPQDGPLETFYGRYTITYTRAEDRWLEVARHFSLLPPASR
jgi:ketosteroid isomerase-like protein